jgi:hypothetical protein
MNGVDDAAVCLGDAQCIAIRIGARKTPPPTPVSPETNPTPAPVGKNHNTPSYQDSAAGFDLAQSQRRGLEG